MATLTTPAIRNFIGGAWQSSARDPRPALPTPAPGAPLAQSPAGFSAEVDAAAKAAQAAFPAWRATPPGDRIQFLFKLKALLEKHFDELAAIITTENGKTLVEAKAEL